MIGEKARMTEAVSGKTIAPVNQSPLLSSRAKETESSATPATMKTVPPSTGGPSRPPERGRVRHRGGAAHPHPLHPHEGQEVPHPHPQGPRRGEPEEGLPGEG